MQQNRLIGLETEKEFFIFAVCVDIYWHLYCLFCIRLPVGEGIGQILRFGMGEKKVVPLFVLPAPEIRYVLSFHEG